MSHVSSCSPVVFISDSDILSRDTDHVKCHAIIIFYERVPYFVGMFKRKVVI